MAEPLKSISLRVQDGELLTPDPHDPSHRFLNGIFSALCKEFDIPATLFLLPVTGRSQASRHLSKLKMIGSFHSQPHEKVIIMPECAAEFFSKGEIEAALTHEFGHLRHPRLSSQKTQQAHQVERLFADRDRQRETAVSKGKEPGWRERRISGKAEKAWNKLSEISTRMEVEADEFAIASGRASDSIATLQKIHVTRNSLAMRDAFGSLKHAAHELMEAGPEGLYRLDDTRRETAQDAQHNSTKLHTAETFRERIARFEKAAENEPSRSR